MHHRSILTAAVVSVMLASGAFAQQPAATKPAPGAPQAAAPTGIDITVARRMSIDEVKKRLDAGEKFTIIDTRSKFTGPMVAGALLVPVDKVPEWSKDKPKDTLILAYCT